VWRSTSRGRVASELARDAWGAPDDAHSILERAFLHTLEEGP
jgi:hypothetical protein